MQPGQVIGPIRGPSGFQLLQLVETRTQAAGGGEQVTQFSARQIRSRSTKDRRRSRQGQGGNPGRCIAGGADFAKLAAEDSDDATTKRRGGDLGWFTSDTYGNAFAMQVAALSDGQSSAPFKTDAGWVIVNAWAAARWPRAADTIRARVRDTIGRRKLEDEWNRFLREMRGEAYVDVRGAQAAAAPAASSGWIAVHAPRLALVPGELAGIGPELVVRALQRDWDANPVDRVRRPRVAGRRRPFPRFAASPHLALVDIANAVRPRPARPTRATPMVVDASNAPLQGCLDGDFDGWRDRPVHKGVINDAGILFSGTTGLLARQAGCEVVMMLANPGMRVALQTVHLPLRAAGRDHRGGAGIDPAHRRRVLRHAFGIAEPTIAVLGLNLHAGEDGHLGHEERDVIAPALARLRGEGMRLVGPLPADTAFLPAKLAGFDAVLAMYHDQGLPVLKHSDFANAVNLTLGLPYPRVAVDHGTALDLAGTGTADPSSLFAAIRTCARLATASARPRPAP